ncbi:abc transporter family protein [Stylonychia lemnae]|uniref:Abc transporter family protein n=1 Tax=Stylonychia lemnae TaxID=5949 RepID=A0A078ACY9_STYLE|nr:abc transporter family protein [Stylonychia lemnae]|eukprot:CDW80084.1 abc transporter family protein [Stylonychia lemnae]
MQGQGRELKPQGIDVSPSQKDRDLAIDKDGNKYQADDQTSALLKAINDKIKEKNAKKNPPMVPYKKILLTFADRTDRLFLTIGFSSAILCGLGLPSFVFLFGDIADSFQGFMPVNEILDRITNVAMILTLIGLGVWVFSYLFFSFLIIASERIGQKTRCMYLQAILRQEISWFDEINTSQLSSRLGKECQAIQRAIGEKIGTIVMAFAMSCSGLFFAFFKGAYFSAFLMCYFPLMFFMSMVITIAFSKGFSENMKAYGQSAGYAEQALNAIKVVFAFGQEETEIKNYEKYLMKARKTGIKTHFTGALAIGGFFLSLYGYYSYSFYIGSFMVTESIENINSKKIYTSGDVMACFLGLVYGIFSLGLAAPNFKALTEGRVAGKMAYEIIERVPKINLDDPQAEQCENLTGQIEFKNVTFSYPTRPEQKILDDFSAVFEEGKTTALVGASGSGKSTIVQLIERFYDPDHGSVYVDGKNLNKINLRKFREKIGYVGQEPVLFNMSIKENILYGNPNASNEEVIQALKSANAWDFIQEKMIQNGIDTNVGNSGGQLSGGQKQRLAIARAFIKKPKILLLDEATSALDKKNEKEVQAAIDKIRQELGSVTTIVVAHRLSTIKEADKIIVMQKGKIKEVGTHRSLISEYPEGIYSKFVKEQEQAEQHVDMNDNSQEIQEEQEQQKIISQVNYSDNSATVVIKKKTQKELDLEKLELDMKVKVDQQDQLRDDKEAQFMKSQGKKSQFSRLLVYNRPRINIFIGIFVSIAQGGLMPIFGGVMAKMLFVLMEVQDLGQMRKESNYWCAIMLIMACGAFLTGFSQKFSFGIIGENVTANIRKGLYRKIIEKHQGWFDERDNAPGVLTSTLASDAQIINGVSTEGLGSILEAICAVLAGIGIGFYFSWRMSLVCIGCTPFIVISGYMGAKFQQGLSVESADSHKFANLLAGDAIMNYRTVASFAHEQQIVKDFETLLNEPRKKAVKQANFIGGSYGFSQFVLYGVIATLFYAGAQFLNAYNENPLHMFITIFAMMFGALESGQAQQFGPDMGKAKQAATKILKIMDQDTQITSLRPKDEEIVINSEKFIGEIEFKNVWFRYPSRKNDWVLKGLNLKIRPNETVALVGESGCGKSTTVSLLLRFYDPDLGSITIDGIDIKQYNLRSLRQTMGLVMQEPTLFNYSIQENILYGNLSAKNSEIREAAQVANALEFIESQQILQFDESCEGLFKEFKNRFETIVKVIGEKEYASMMVDLQSLVKDEIKKGQFKAVEGDIDTRQQQELFDIQLSQGFKIDCGLRGSKLSGGQKQRIAIARAIIRKPRILILDEATSALDEESQKKVQIALDNIMIERTSIVIAHRLSTVEKCDRVVVLESGNLVEEGKFQELKNKEGGYFAQLASGMQKNTGAQTQNKEE